MTSFQRLQDVYTTSPASYRRYTGVETTSCVYWEVTERRRRVDPRFRNTDSTAALKITCLILIRPCPNIVLKYQDSNDVRLNTWLRFEYWAIFVNINSNIASNILLITFLVMERVKLNVAFITSVTTLMTQKKAIPSST